MASNNPHLFKTHSLFSMFCLSYLPLFALVSIKILVANQKYLHPSKITIESITLCLQNFGLIFILILLTIYAIVGTSMTMKNILKKEQSAFPVKIQSIKPKNEDAVSYLGTYVIPLLMKGEVGIFEYSTFIVLFTVYFKLYSTSSLILVNPILNMKYGLYEITYREIKNSDSTDAIPDKTAFVISKHKWVEEGDASKFLKLSHRLYFAF